VSKLSASAEARRRIRELTRSLERNNFVWAAARFRLYLDGKAPSLDSAFGLVPRRGSPRKNSTLARDTRVIARKCAEKSWEDIKQEMALTDSQLRDAKRMIAGLQSEPLTPLERSYHLRAVAAFSAVASFGNKFRKKFTTSA